MVGMCLSLGGPDHRLGLLCGPGHVEGGDPDSPTPRVLHCERTNAPILLGGTSDQGLLTWPWSMAQVGQDRFTLVLCGGRRRGTEGAEGPVSSRSKIKGRGGDRGGQRGVGPWSMECTSLTS